MQKLLPLLITLSLQAHDLYLMPKDFRVKAGTPLLLSAHTGDSFPFSEQGVDPARLTTIGGDETTRWTILGKTTHAAVKPREGGQYFAIFTKPRFLEMEPDKFLDYLKEEGLNWQFDKARSSKTRSREMYAKYAKTYVVAGTPDQAFSKPLGLKIEIVPLQDPSTLKAGDTLPIQLLFDGKPASDIQLEIATSPSPKAKSILEIAGRTDANGRLNINVKNAGKVRLHAVHMLSVQQPTHDWESYWASLTLEAASADGARSSNLTSR